MMDESRGWAFIYHFGSRYGSLLRTEDGGETWKNVTYQCEYRIASILDSDIAWGACGRGENVTAGGRYLVRTKDGGETWERMGYSPEDDVSFDGAHSAIYRFSDANNGLLFAHSGVTINHVNIYQTNDGGLSWNPITSVTLNRACNETLNMNNHNQRLFIVDHCGSGSPCSPHTSYSDDYGKTWNYSQISCEETVTPFWDYSDIPVFFADDGVLPIKYAIVSEEDGRLVGGMALYVTENNGVSWRPSGKLLTDNRRGDIQILSLHDVIVQCGNDLCVTRDGGQSWETIATTLPSPNSEDMEYIKQFEFINPLIGWANIGDGRLYKTSDGGHTWVDLPPIVIPSNSLGIDSD